MEVAEPYVFSEIVNSPDFFIACNSRLTCLTEVNSLVYINNVTQDSWNIIEIGDVIKGIRLQPGGSWIAVATGSKNLLIVDLIGKATLIKFDGFYSIEHFRWVQDDENSFFMVRTDGLVEKVTVLENESSLIKIPVSGVVYFEQVVGDNGLLIVFTNAGEVKVVRLKGVSVTFDRFDPNEVGSLRSIDSDIFCVQTVSYVKFYSISEKFKSFIVRKQVIKFESTSGVLLFTDHLSRSATVVPLSIFKVYKYEGLKYEIGFIDTQLELELIPKSNSKGLDLAARHNNKVYIYPLTFEKTLNPSNEILTFSRDGVNQVIENLSKRFEESLKKLEKAMQMMQTSENVQKSVQYSLDKHSEENILNLTSSVYSNLIDSFKSEVLTTLTTQLETDLKELLNKFSFFFQDRLKFKLERNTREEERSKKLAVHLKSVVINFMSFEEQIKKTTSRKSKVLNDFDIRCIENTDNQEKIDENNGLFALKAELDGLLHKKKYENAISRALQEKDFFVLYGVLQVLQPKALIDSKSISQKTAFLLFSKILNNIHESKSFPDIFQWLEELVNGIQCSDIQSSFSRIVEESFKYPSLTSLARICSKKLEEGFKMS
jgi:hypothetical protein